MHSGPAGLFRAPRKHRRLKTFSESRPTHKASSSYTSNAPLTSKASPNRLRLLYEKPPNERKTRKKVCNNPVAYFRTLPDELNAPGLDELLFGELFGERADLTQRARPDSEESMELVNLKNSSIRVSKVFASNVFECTPCKSERELDTTLHKESDAHVSDDAGHIHALIDQLGEAVRGTKLDSRTRLKLQESMAAMRKALASKKPQFSRSFTKYLCNSRPTLLYRN